LREPLNPHILKLDDKFITCYKRTWVTFDFQEENGMHKGLAITAVWVGAALLGYAFHLSGILTGANIGWIVFVAFIATVAIAEMG
jgi:hypothetical protein